MFNNLSIVDKLRMFSTEINQIDIQSIMLTLSLIMCKNSIIIKGNFLIGDYHDDYEEPINIDFTIQKNHPKLLISSCEKIKFCTHGTSILVREHKEDREC